jgi:hypothetical protein
VVFSVLATLLSSTASFQAVAQSRVQQIAGSGAPGVDAERIPPGIDLSGAMLVDAETSPAKRVWQRADGSRIAQVSSRPVRYKGADRSWRDFDTDLVPAGSDRLAATAAPDAARLARSAGAGVATVETPAGPITLRHPGAAAVGAVVERNTATYPRALPGGRDLSLTATPDGFKESVVVFDLSAPASYVEEFVLPPGVTARSADAAQTTWNTQPAPHPAGRSERVVPAHDQHLLQGRLRRHRLLHEGLL